MWVSVPDPHTWLSFWTCGDEIFADLIGYCNPKYDELVTRMDKELDPAKRLALAEAAGRLLLADARDLPLQPDQHLPGQAVRHRILSDRTQPEWPGLATPLAVDIARQE